MPASSLPPPGAVTVERLDATSPWRRFRACAAAGPGPGPGWVRLGDRLANPAALDAWYRDELEGTARGHRDLAGALIVYRFAGSLAELVVGPLLGQRRALLLTPSNVWLRLGELARLDEVAVAAPEVAVRPDDAAAGTPGARVVADGAALRAVAVDALLATFGPLADAVRDRAPFGRRGMWGTLADHVAEVALRRAAEAGRDQRAAWEAAEALLDALAAHEPLLVARPRPHEVPVGDRVRLFATKGTCCLVYKAAGPSGAADPSGRAGPPGAVAARRLIDEAACTSCPLRDEADRHARLVRYLTS